MGRLVVIRNVPLELVDKQRGTLLTAELMANGILNLDLIEDGAVVKFNEESIADGPLLGSVVLFRESLVFHTVNLGAECVNAGVSSGSVGAKKMASTQGQTGKIIKRTSSPKSTRRRSTDKQPCS